MQPTVRLLICLLLACVGLTAQAGAPRQDWPHWLGPSRNAHSAVSSGWTGGAWPGSELWQTNVGDGSTSPVVAAGKLYTMGWSSGNESVFCLDAATGKQLWRSSYAAPKYGRHATGDQNFYGGASATPEIDPQTGMLYTLGIDGDLNCWDTRAGGKQVWGLNLYERYGVGQRPQATKRGGTLRDYGYTTAPLVQGDTVIVEVGDDEGSLMGFDCRTGDRRWTSECKQQAGHSGGPVPMTVEGVPCVAVLTIYGLLVARLDGANAGKTVAEFPWVTDFANNIPTPAVEGEYVLVTSAYNHRRIVKLRIALKGAEKVWDQPYCSGVCGPLIHQGKVYWAWQGLNCLNWETGELEWSGGRFGDPASLALTADDRLIGWANEGDLVLAETAKRSPGEYQQLAAKTGIFQTEAWPHLAVADGRVYVKDRAGNLKCFLLPIP